MIINKADKTTGWKEHRDGVIRYYEDPYFRVRIEQNNIRGTKWKAEIWVAPEHPADWRWEPVDGVTPRICLFHNKPGRQPKMKKLYPTEFDAK